MYSSQQGPRHRAVLRHRGKIALAAGAVVLAGSVATIAPAQAANKVVTANLIDLSETRATGHNVFSTPAAGVRVYTEGNGFTDKAAGYFDVDKSLSATAAVEPTMSWTPNGANLLRPGLQLKVDFNGDGSIDGTLVGEPTYADGSPLYGNDWWATNGSRQFVKDGAPSHIGGSGSENHGTLNAWKTAFPNARVIQAGWSLGSGVKGDGNLLNLVVAGDVYTFAAAPAQTSVVLREGDVDLTQTRANGSNVFLPGGGVRIKTFFDPPPTQNTNLAKAAGYFSTCALPLSQAGEPSMEYAAISGTLRPSVQLVTDFDNDGTADGILVGEPTYANGSPLYGNDWWLTNSASPVIKADAPSHEGGFGSENHGRLAEWRTVFPNAKVLAAGWSLGSGVEGEGIINAITVGTTTYTFAGNTAPTASPVNGSTAFGTPVTVTLAGSDAEGDPLTYTAGPSANGTVSVSGDQATFTPAYGFSGTATFPYTVKDATHPAAASTVSIVVGAPPVDPRLSVNAKVVGRSVTLSGKSTNALPVAGSITVTENGVHVKGSGVIARNYNIPLGTVTSGVHVYKVNYAGASSTIVVTVP